MTGLFDEGAGDLDSDAFQNRLDDAGAEMRFSGGRDAIYGSMRMLADQKDEALELLRLADREAALRPGADRPHPQPDRRRHHRRRPRSRDGRTARLVEGALRRPSLFAPGRGHASDAGLDHRRRSEDAASPPVCPRQSDRRRGRRDRRRDAEEGARPAVRRPAGEGRADAGRRCRAQARAGDRHSLRPAADDAAGSPIPAKTATSRNISPPI